MPAERMHSETSSLLPPDVAWWTWKPQQSLPPTPRERGDSLPWDASQASSSSSSLDLFRVSSLVPLSSDSLPWRTRTPTCLRSWQLAALPPSHKCKASTTPESPPPTIWSPLSTPTSPELQPMVPHPPATLPPAQRRRHLATAHREPKDENTCLKELNRNQKALLAVYRKEILDLKAQILGLQQTVRELREHNVNLQDDALEALIPELLFTSPQPPSTQHPVHRRQPRATACAPGLGLREGEKTDTNPLRDRLEAGDWSSGLCSKPSLRRRMPGVAGRSCYKQCSQRQVVASVASGIDSTCVKIAWKTVTHKGFAIVESCCETKN
ncbi:hypothetical protein CAPTEDRAFT_205045 [Capitella teleta]|uniref:Uncharacterized protein n=1 Tax=Capitella teleta TaxID=283909 RepID=R7T9T1_CAPTE|nr:hypothetical protein CAPTEDRAFT_205045 [Capitella teleta]|eukprot:ELT90267.1 hypothetical protein CAPTEDRAFT_205045 [Capitella teleta]